MLLLTIPVLLMYYSGLGFEYCGIIWAGLCGYYIMTRYAYKDTHLFRYWFCLCCTCVYVFPATPVQAACFILLITGNCLVCNIWVRRDCQIQCTIHPNDSHITTCLLEAVMICSTVGLMWWMCSFYIVSGHVYWLLPLPLLFCILSWITHSCLVNGLKEMCVMTCLAAISVGYTLGVIHGTIVFASQIFISFGLIIHREVAED